VTVLTDDACERIARFILFEQKQLSLSEAERLQLVTETLSERKRQCNSQSPISSKLQKLLSHCTRMSNLRGVIDDKYWKELYQLADDDEEQVRMKEEMDRNKIFLKKCFYFQLVETGLECYNC
jgi:hypothetical protein